MTCFPTGISTHVTVHFAMEVTDANLQALGAYLQKTLLPDAVERRSGSYLCCSAAVVLSVVTYFL